MDVDSLVSTEKDNKKKIQGVENLQCRGWVETLICIALKVCKSIKSFMEGDVKVVYIVNEQVRTRSNGFKLGRCRFKK